MSNLRVHVGVSCLIACLSLPGILGCGSQGEDRLPVYPVTGKVLVGGQPADGASVIFYAQSPTPEGKDRPVPGGLTDANGDFKLTSYDPGDGAPAGEYKVAVVWNEKPPAEMKDGIFEPRDRLKGRYATPQRTTLTATVEEGDNELPPFEI